MNYVIRTFVLSAIFFLRNNQARLRWEYGGPNEFPECKELGGSQSPINIVSSKADEVSDDVEINFSWERKKTQMNVYTENNGNTVTFRAPEMKLNLELIKSEYPGVYNFDHAVFHWGKSEHQIDEIAYSGEIEFMMYKGENPPKLDDVRVSGIIIVSILFEEDPLLSTEQEKTSLEGFKSTLKHVKYPGTKHTTNLTDLSWSFEKWLPEIKDMFIYVGTFSSPPCTEGVVRMVFKCPIKVTSDFMTQFKGIKNRSHEPMENTFRQLPTAVNMIVKSYSFK